MTTPESSSPETMRAFGQFRARVVSDPALMEKLCVPNSAEAFTALVVGVGAEHGFVFTVDDVQAGLLAARKAWMERWIA